MLFVAMGMNLIMAGSIMYMNAMIRSLQIILHLPLFQVIVPGNVTMLFSAIIPIAMFDILEDNPYIDP